MNLNQLYFDHQMSLIRADGANTPCLRQRHEHHAAQIAGRIGRLQSTLGAEAACSWHALAGAAA